MEGVIQCLYTAASIFLIKFFREAQGLFHNAPLKGASSPLPQLQPKMLECTV